MGYISSEDASRLRKPKMLVWKLRKGGLSGHTKNAVKQRKVIRASKFTVVSFDAVIGDCLRNKDGTQGTCVDSGTLL